MVASSDERSLFADVAFEQAVRFRPELPVTSVHFVGHDDAMDHASFATWNLEWAPHASARSDFIRAQLAGVQSDVICLTEAMTGFLQDGHTIEADADYGYLRADGRRKVSLWSRFPWRSISRGEGLPFPGGRFVAGITDTPLGPIHVVGVCIPWRDAHVRSGRRDRMPWEDHLAFLRALAAYLRGFDCRTAVIGDFNQRVPKSRQPNDVFEALQQCFSEGFKIATAGLIDVDGGATIDHLALASDLQLESLEVLPALSPGGLRLSDHFGFSARFSSASERPQ